MIYTNKSWADRRQVAAKALHGKQRCGYLQRWHVQESLRRE